MKIKSKNWLNKGKINLKIVSSFRGKKYINKIRDLTKIKLKRQLSQKFKKLNKIQIRFKIRLKV